MAKKKKETFDPNNPPKHVKKGVMDIPDEGGDRYPYVRILQSGSPELKKLKKKATEEERRASRHIEGAEVGDLIITGAGNSIVVKEGEGLRFIPLAVKDSWIQRHPKDKGGTFVGQYNSKEEMQAAKEAGTEITYSIDYLVALPDLDPENVLYISLSFNSNPKMAGAKIVKDTLNKYDTTSGVTFVLDTEEKTSAKYSSTYYTYTVVVEGWTSESNTKLLNEVVDEHTQRFLPEGSEEY